MTQMATMPRQQLVDLAAERLDERPAEQPDELRLALAALYRNRGADTPDLLTAHLDRVGDAIDDRVAEALHELVTAQLADRGPLTRLLRSGELRGTALALGTITLGIPATGAASNNTAALVLVWGTIAIVNLACAVRRRRTR